MNDPTQGRPRSGSGSLRETLGVYAAAEPTLQLLVILGSSSRGDAGGAADIELGFVADPGFDAETFQQLTASVLNMERVVLTNLRKSATSAFRAAREGALVFERTLHGFLEFRERAIHNWCELAPVLNAAFDRVEASIQGSARS